VDSRLTGERIGVRLFMDHLEIWYRQKKVDTFPRLRGEDKHATNYRHIIDSLIRKLGAFENYRYRDGLVRWESAPPTTLSFHHPNIRNLKKQFRSGKIILCFFSLKLQNYPLSKQKFIS
jgi:hypothetical protein